MLHDSLYVQPLLRSLLNLRRAPLYIQNANVEAELLNQRINIQTKSSNIQNAHVEAERRMPFNASRIWIYHEWRWIYR